MKADKKKETEEKSDISIKKIVPREERLHPRRVVMAVLFAVITVVSVAADAWIGKLATGGMICEMLLIIPMCLIFIIYMIHERKTKRLWYEDTDYVSLIVLYAIVCLILFLCRMMIPVWLTPVMIVAFILSPFKDRALSMTASLIAVVTYAFAAGADGKEMCLFICEVITAVMLSDIIVKSKRAARVSLLILVVAVQMVLPLSVRYFDKLTVTEDELLYTVALAVVTGLFAILFMPLINDRVGREKAYHYQTILDNDYPLTDDIKRFSPDEYERARRLSILSLKAAQAIGADAYLAAAGGLYYRVGLIRGSKEIDCAMDIAAENGFPEKLTAILYEYQGIIRHPTSKESAIVHMCDAVMRRIDAIAKHGNQMDSGWNKQMLIYQALNELSSQGIYDESTITINQFLKIRDVLVRNL